MTRLYVVVRNDIADGLQIAQACHATREFTLRHPREDVGENLVVLQASPERLARLADDAEAVMALARFHEPDLGGELTAVAFGGEGRRLCSELALALRRTEEQRRAAAGLLT